MGLVGSGGQPSAAGESVAVDEVFVLVAAGAVDLEGLVDDGLDHVPVGDVALDRERLAWPVALVDVVGDRRSEIFE